MEEKVLLYLTVVVETRCYKIGFQVCSYLGSIVWIVSETLASTVV